MIRELHKHPWIVDPFEDGGKNDPLEEGNRSMIDEESVLKWIAEVE